MTRIKDVDLRGFVIHSMTGVFETMLSMKIEAEDPPQRESVTTGNHIVGTVGFAGKAMGNVSVFVSRDFGRQIAAAMLGMSVEEIGSDDEVHDVIGEVCNMVGGDLKSRLCDAGLTCSLSIPSITSGNSFRVESKGCDRHELLGFRNSHNSTVVEVYVKNAN